jgi:hypothetical protein
MEQLEEKINLNFSIPTGLSRRIDRLLIDLKEKGSVRIKTKIDLMIELLTIGVNVKSKDLM